MKTLKNKILTVLLLSFAFFVMHDYFVTELHIEKHKLIHLEKIESKKEMQAHMHESIHTVFSMNFFEDIPLEGKLADLKPSNLFFSITSNVSLVPQRPPSV